MPSFQVVGEFTAYFDEEVDADSLEDAIEIVRNTNPMDLFWVSEEIEIVDAVELED